MAAAFWEREGGDARSAGSQPASAVHEAVVDVMHEVGVDLTARHPHRVSEADAEWADIVVTMGCGDACPYIPGKRYIDWELEDPAGKDLAAVRVIRDDVQRHVAALARELRA